MTAERSIDWQRILLSDCEGLARRLQAAGGHWHSHVLSPGCAHNPGPDYAVVIEDDDAGVSYLAKGTGEFPEVDKVLVRMLHGDDILDATKADGTKAPPASALLSRVRDLDARRVPWHHHMHFPACVFNPHPGLWSISVESPEGTFSESYADEPRGILREVEVLYFATIERHLKSPRGSQPPEKQGN